MYSIRIFVSLVFDWTAPNGSGRLQQRVSGGSLSLNYTYQANGSIATIVDNTLGNTQTFTYDNGNCLASAVGTGGSGAYASRTYTYDATTGNLTGKDGVTQYYNNASHKHAVSSTSNGKSFGYDANGNMTTRK